MKIPAVLLALSALALPRPLGAADAAIPVLRIDAAHVAARVSPTLYGLMTEEINHSYDGGLYAELVSNRTLRDDPAGPAHWSAVQQGGGSCAMALDEGEPMNAMLTTSLKLTLNSAGKNQRVGVANDGFWGIPVQPNTRYHASFYAKLSGDFFEPFRVALESADGATTYAEADLPHGFGDWHLYSVDFATGKVPASAHNRLVITTTHCAGIVWLDLVSLFPPTWHERPNGNRVDLMRKLAALHPAFLRFPGGNYLEGDTIGTRFNWKSTIHGLDQRIGHPQPWGYRSSDGLGLLEFLDWCEDLQMQPVLAVFAGYALDHDHIAAGPKLQPFVQDALDEIEYVTGAARTRWGAERAQDGHPAPFPLTYVEIGNEDNADPSGSYDGRFAQFYDAIKAKYPGLQIIATSPIKSRVPDVYDEHYYRSARDMEADAHRYDGHPRRGPRIFVGEWATREGSPTPNLNAALGDSAWMTGLERNSDLVIMASYAPLLVNVNPGAAQWTPDLIGYDGLTSYGSPAYYAQVMFSRHHGDGILSSACDAIPGFFYSVTRDSRTGMIYLKAVNTTAAPRDVRIEIAGVKSIGPEAKVVVLSSARPTDTNTLAEPAKIVPVAAKLPITAPGFLHRFGPYSVSVLLLPAR